MMTRDQLSLLTTDQIYRMLKQAPGLRVDHGSIFEHGVLGSINYPASIHLMQYWGSLTVQTHSVEFEVHGMPAYYLEKDYQEFVGDWKIRGIPFGVAVVKPKDIEFRKFACILCYGAFQVFSTRTSK